MSLRFYMLYRLESLVTNLNLSWTSRSDDSLYQDWCCQDWQFGLRRNEQLEREQERNAFHQLEKVILKG